jgi:hypothetical protein
MSVTTFDETGPFGILGIARFEDDVTQLIRGTARGAHKNSFTLIGKFGPLYLLDQIDASIPRHYIPEYRMLLQVYAEKE